MKTFELIEQKLAQGPKNLRSILGKRFSPRVFNGSHISEEDISALLEAARFAPSSSNRQPWFYYVARFDTPGFAKVLSFLDDSNQTWAKHAGVLFVGCAVKEDEKGKNKYAKYDLGQASLSIVIEALSRGLYARQMGGFDKEKAVEVLGIPDTMKPMACIAVGHIGDYEKADQELVKKDLYPRHRKEVVFKNV